MHAVQGRGAMLRRDAMSDSGAVLPWLVIRQDDNGNRYRVGRYATQDEAQRTADKLQNSGHKQLYWVERTGQAARP
ncbi:SPOR domain-containing protein [Streptomyces sp. NPDC002809]|uniref:SPOR domain-containing protein n=1 Tax=Streptomyces sp. NPDC002809 TaxID=3154433 RepID=UPI00332F3164